MYFLFSFSIVSCFFFVRKCVLVFVSFLCVFPCYHLRLKPPAKTKSKTNILKSFSYVFCTKKTNYHRYMSFFLCEKCVYFLRIQNVFVSIQQIRHIVFVFRLFTVCPSVMHNITIPHKSFTHFVTIWKQALNVAQVIWLFGHCFCLTLIYTYQTLNNH